MHIQIFTFNAFQENTYVLYNDAGDAWIIDPGMMTAQEEQVMDDFIKQQKLRPQAIINTHAHIDHVMGVEYLKQCYQIPFYLHPKDEPVLQSAAGSAAMFGLPFGKIPAVEEALKEDTTIMLEDVPIQLIWVPGHSPGSVAFYNEKEKWVISGDVLFAGSIGRTDLPGGHHEQLLQSIQNQLFTLPEDVTVYPGHGPATTIGQEKMYNPFF